MGFFRACFVTIIMADTIKNSMVVKNRFQQGHLFQVIIELKMVLKKGIWKWLKGFTLRLKKASQVVLFHTTNVVSQSLDFVKSFYELAMFQCHDIVTQRGVFSQTYLTRNFRQLCKLPFFGSIGVFKELCHHLIRLFYIRD